MASPSLRRAGELGKPAAVSFSYSPGAGAGRTAGRWRWLPGRHASGGPEDALRYRPSEIPASVRGTDSLVTVSRFNGSAARALADDDPQLPTLRCPRLGRSHLGGVEPRSPLGQRLLRRRAQEKPCLQTRFSRDRDSRGRFPRCGVLGVGGTRPPVSPLRLGTDRRVRWVFAGGLEMRSTQEDGFLILLPARPRRGGENLRNFPRVFSLLSVLVPTGEDFFELKEAMLEMALACITLAVSANLFIQFS